MQNMCVVCDEGERSMCANSKPTSKVNIMLRLQHTAWSQRARTRHITEIAEY